MEWFFDLKIKHEIYLTQLTFGVLNDLGVVALHDGNARVGSSQVDSDDSKESQWAIPTYDEKAL